MASSNQSDQSTQAVISAGSDSSAPPRDALVATAVKFLQNPKVSQSPLATRKAFLKKKGLTDEEVELAIRRSGSAEEVLPLRIEGSPLPLDSPHFAAVPHSPNGYRWRDYGALAVMMVGISYGCHLLYKKYIHPFIMDSREDKKHLQKMESNIAAMSGTLTQTVGQLQHTMTLLQELLVQQQQKIQELSQELTAAETASASSRILDNQMIGDLKTEIVSLKGLLLSRRQFPSTPSISKIPSWQIPLKGSPASSPQSVNHSSSDISPVSNESANSSPIKDGSICPSDALGGPLSEVVGLETTLPLHLKDQVPIDVQGEDQLNGNIDKEKEETSIQSEQTDDYQSEGKQEH
ncbi:peroxisomal membrane protein PEX14 [Stigmatopora nigra]